MISITKLNKNHINLIDKLICMSNEITTEDLKPICEVFSSKSKNKSELDELISYQEKNNFEFDKQRASEKFVLELSQLI